MPKNSSVHVLLWLCTLASITMGSRLPFLNRNPSSMWTFGDEPNTPQVQFSETGGPQVPRNTTMRPHRHQPVKEAVLFFNEEDPREVTTGRANGPGGIAIETTTIVPVNGDGVNLDRVFVPPRFKCPPCTKFNPQLRQCIRRVDCPSASTSTRSSFHGKGRDLSLSR